MMNFPPIPPPHKRDPNFITGIIVTTKRELTSLKITRVLHPPFQEMKRSPLLYVSKLQKYSFRFYSLVESPGVLGCWG